MKKSAFCLALTVALASASLTTQAQETRYISDELYVPLRSGQGNQYRIIHRGLRSGSALKLLETSEDGEWNLVEMKNGEQGWIRSQYLLDKPTASILLAQAELELEKLRSSYNNLNTQLKALKGDKTSIAEQASDLQSERDQLEKELNDLKQLSSGAIDLNQRYQQLFEKHEMIQTQADILKADNERLKNDKSYNQWIYGASILGAGMLFTLILQGFNSRKRRAEWIN